MWCTPRFWHTNINDRTLTSALEGRTQYKVVYGMNLDHADLHAFAAPCASIKLSKKLKKLDQAMAGKW